MRFTCKSCSRSYAIPDERVRDAGGAGLRIRCKSCRAIMAIDVGTAVASTPKARTTLDDVTLPAPPSPHFDLPHLASSDDESEDVTANERQRLRRGADKASERVLAEMSGPVPEASSEEASATPIRTKPARMDARALASSSDARPAKSRSSSRAARVGSHAHAEVDAGFITPAMTDVHAAFELPEGLPATLSASGIYRPMPGVDRRVRGVALDPRRDLRQRWYAAIDGEPRGPFSEDELVRMAHEGRIRGRTLVWRPGFDAWTRIRSQTGERDDLGWLRAVVVERKRSELIAAERAKRAMGIHAIHLADKDDGTSYPPQLPSDALELSSLSLVDAALVDGGRGLVDGIDDGPRHRVLAATVAGALMGALLVVVLFYTVPAFWR